MHVVGFIDLIAESIIWKTVNAKCCKNKVVYTRMYMSESMSE